MKKTVAELRKEWSYKEIDYKNPENQNLEKVILLTKYKGDSKHVVLPLLIGTKVVLGITYPGFSGNKSITSVQVPENIKLIGEEVFSGCKALKKVEVLGKDVTMGDYCFEDCSELTELQIDVSSTEFGKHMFKGCCGLQCKEGFVIIGDGESKTLVDIQLPFSFCTVTIPDGVVRLLGAALSDYNDGRADIKNLRSIRKVVLPESVKEIGDEFFSECISLQQINIPKGVQKIGDYAFQKCESLREIHIPETVEELGKDVFGQWNRIDIYGKEGSSIETYVRTQENLTFMKEEDEFSFQDDPLLVDFDIKNETLFHYFGFEQHLVIPNSIKRIGSNVLLYKEYTIELLEISGNTKRIDPFAFYMAGNIKQLVLQEGIEEIGEYAFYGAMIEELVIPGTIKEIGKGAFFACIKLKKVIIEPGVEIIQRETFSLCEALEMIEIPDTVTEIGDQAFYGCYKLKN